jgi:hypothetical protein
MGSAVGPLRGGISPPLSGLEPSSGFLLLLLLPCACLLMFLKGLSGSFRHGVPPATAFHLSRRRAPVLAREACASPPREV